MSQFILILALRDKFSEMNLGDVSVKKFGNDIDYLIKFENKKIGAANESLENSIESNYTGVFEPKTNFKTEKSRLAWKN